MMQRVLSAVLRPGIQGRLLWLFSIGLGLGWLCFALISYFVLTLYFSGQQQLPSAYLSTLAYGSLCTLLIWLVVFLPSYRILQKIHRLSQALPLLMASRHGEFRQQLNQYQKTDVSNDETDELYQAAGELSWQLEMAEQELRSRADERHWLASHDAITGLLKRRAIERLLTEVVNANQHGCVLVLGLDNVKAIAATTSDKPNQYLLLIGRLLMRLTAGKVPLAHFGSDVFVLILAGVYRERAGFVAARLLKRLASVQLGQWRCSASIGIAEYPSCGEQTSELLSRADAAMYQAKLTGSNGWRVAYPERNINLMSPRQAWRERVREARAEGRLQWLLQPVHGRHGPVFYEMLLRYVDDQGQLLPPGPLLQAAEQVGLSADIDLYAVEWALKLLHRDGMAPVALSINLATATFTDQHAMNWLLQALQRTSLNPGQLLIEVREHTLLANLDYAARMIRTLNELGCQVIWDDFGQGAASLHPLLELPITYVKVDGVLIRSLLEQPRLQGFAQQLVQTAAALDITLIAEQVDNEQNLAALINLGFCYWQGFPLSEPQSVEQLFCPAHVSGA